jgi:hypothetical protein
MLRIAIGAWLKGILARTFAGRFGWLGPEESVGHVVHALDLGLLAPLGIATGVLLLRRRPGAYLIAAVLLTMAVCMGAGARGATRGPFPALGKSRSENDAKLDDPRGGGCATSAR